jgi:hypothetical protein
MSKQIVQRTAQVGVIAKFKDFVRNGAWGIVDQGNPVGLPAQAYLRSVQDQQPRLSLQTLTADMFVAASAAMTLGNPSPMARINDAMLQTDPEIKAALKQLKTAVGGVEFTPTPPNDSDIAAEIAEGLRVALADPRLNLRALKGWIVEHRIRGGGIVEAVWNDPSEEQRTWERFVTVPQQRFRLNRVTGEPQFAATPYVYQGTNVSDYDLGKWIVVTPDLHVQDFALRGITAAMLNDWFGRMNVMGWWQQSLERDAMKILVGKAGSDADAESMDYAFKNRGAAGAFLVRDPQSSVSALEGTLSRSGISPYGEFMTHTAQRMFLALLGESQTGIVEKNAGSTQSADSQHAIARYVIEDLCNDISFIGTRDLFAPWVAMNYGEENLVNAPVWTAKLDEPIDIVALNEAIAGRPANVKLGVGWYRKATQWPEPLPTEEPLDAPLPMPGQFPGGGNKPVESEVPGPKEKKNDSESAGAPGE